MACSDGGSEAPGGEADSERKEEGKGEGEGEEGEGEEGGEESPSHLPLAPPYTELLDTSTTVDPSYIISLIRQLLPCDSRMEKQSPKIVLSSQQNVGHHPKNKQNSPVIMDDEMNGEAEKWPNGDVPDEGQTEASEIKDPWEDAGCILWDLSASRTHAEFMVNNYILDVLLAILQVSESSRAMEICLGIFGNLACHESLGDVIASRNGLIETVVDQLFLDDSTCLSEAFRLLAVSLQGSASMSWAKALLSDPLLSRILWIVRNTLNSTLLEKGVELLLAIVDNQEVLSILLQPLINLGLQNDLVSIFACELSKLREETKIERCTSLDLILRLLESISAMDSYSPMISFNEELFHLVCGVIRLPDKIEIAGSCASAVMIIANILADEQHLTSGLSQDLPFLQGLLDILPFLSDDSQARDALWSILAEIFAHVEEKETSMMTLDNLTVLLLEKFYLIEEDLEGHPAGNGEDYNSSKAYKKSYATTISLRRFICILETWISRKSSEKDIMGIIDVGKAHTLLEYFQKHGH